jgi:hypothetical protein
MVTNLFADLYATATHGTVFSPTSLVTWESAIDNRSKKLKQPLFGQIVRPSSLRRSYTTMVQVTFNGKVIANTEDTIIVENNQYFPPDTVKAEGFTLIESTTK